MGEVWAARNELTNRDFAIKFLLPQFSENDEAFERFVREAKTTGTLQHPSIVDVYDVALGKDGRPFIVMELLHGEELESYIERKGSLSPLMMAAYFAQIAAALQLAHDAGVVHRDLSTNNIFLARGKDGSIVPKILDFGVSKTLGPVFEGQSVTCDGAVLGNPIFMSPEQARGAREVDARTDIWALGVGMYQSLTGRPPFHGTNYNALMVDIMTRRHRKVTELIPTLDSELARAIEDCLIKDRDKRLQTAEQLAQRLGSIARRLSTDPQELGRTPRRRATDLLPAPPSETMAQSGVPLGVRFWHALGLPVPSRVSIGLMAAVMGIAAGLGAGRFVDKPSQVIIQAAAPTPKQSTAREPAMASGTPAPRVVQPIASESGLGRAVTPAVGESGLSRAVTDGLRNDPAR